MTEPSEHAEKKAADPADLRRLTAAIVAAHVAHNVVPPGDVARFITITHAALRAVTQPPADAATAKPVPAVSIRSSVRPDYVVCLEDGATLKTLKRHLAEAHGLTPDEYRRKWSLPSTYPMVAPDYAKQRSAIAKASGLGTRAKAAVPATPPRRSRQTAKRAAPRRSRDQRREVQGVGSTRCARRALPAGTRPSPPCPPRRRPTSPRLVW